MACYKKTTKKAAVKKPFDYKTIKNDAERIKRLRDRLEIKYDHRWSNNRQRVKYKKIINALTTAWYELLEFEQ